MSCSPRAVDVISVTGAEWSGRFVTRACRSMASAPCLAESQQAAISRCAPLALNTAPPQDTSFQRRAWQRIASGWLVPEL